MSNLGNAIAIVGMSLRFPKANTLDEFWTNLVEGRDCAKVLDKQDLLKLGVARDKLESPEYVFRSYDLDNIDKFDAKFFGISPREARMADPQLRLMLEATQECIEDSGHIVQGANTGLYFGVADHKYWLYYNLYSSPLEEQGEVAKRILAFKDFFATQVSHKLDLAGPSISLYSACSTGLLATHEACNHLLMYDCDYALAGGCEVLQGAGYQYLEGGLSARDGYVRAFDKDASGTVFGSGVGVVMLRRLADAIEDGDRIYAVIRSTAVNNDGSQKIGYIAPGVKGQMGVIQEAIARAGISARDISYVEAHGTGTKVGDPIEIEAISKVYRKYTDDNQYCALGSVKTNVGHLSIAAGVAGLIKTALMLHHKKIPPILHYREANPAIDFENSPFYVNRELRDWPAQNGKRIAGISAFGVGGTNVHAIVEEAPETRREVEPSPYNRLFLLTAKSESALHDASQKLAGFLSEHGEADLGDVAYSLNVGRQKFDHRMFVVADSAAKLIEACKKPQNINHLAGQTRPQKVFMFPGQGSQYAGMGLRLYQQEPVFRQHVDQCCEYAKNYLGIDVHSILFPSLSADAPADDRINQTQYTQISLFVVSYSLAQLWMHWGVKPNAMIGHSIGEYVAACLSGVFSVHDALKLVAYRGVLMQSMPKGSMLSVPRPAQDIAGDLDETLSVAGENSPTFCVISGPDESIAQLKSRLMKRDIECSVLHTSHAFHSRMMDPILKAYEGIVREVELHEVGIPFVSNVTGTWITSEQATNPAYWVSQLRQAVLFSKGVQTIATQPSVFLEVGPGTTLCSLVGQNDLPDECVTVSSLPRPKNEATTIEHFLAALGKACCHGVEIDWEAVYGKSGGRRISLPTYPFERKSYWIDEQALAHKPVSAPQESAPLEHPLLGRKVVASAKVVVFENVIDKQTPQFLGDHRLVDTVIFPGAGYAQMGIEIGKYFIKNKKINVDDVRFAQVMMLQDGVRKVVQTVATASGEGCTFEIMSRNLEPSDSNDGSAWVLHAKGRISPHSANPRPVAIPSLVNDASKELVPLSRYYDALKFITFGASFRAIRNLWIGENAQGDLESVSLVELPQHLYSEVDRYSFHPVLLDAAFQTIDGPKISQTGTLPVGLRNFTLYDAVPMAFYVHAVRRKNVDEEYSIGQIRILSRDGALIADIEHYLQKEIADTVAADDQLADVLFEIDWEKVEAQTAEPVATRKAWILVGEADRLTAGLAASLELRGQPVLKLATGFSNEAGRSSEPALDLIRRGEVEAIVFASSLSEKARSHDTALTLSLSLLDLVQHLSRCESESPPRIVIATSGAQLVEEDFSADEYSAHQAALWGLGTSIAVEHPEYRCLKVDLDASDGSLNALLSDLLQGVPSENQLVYRNGQRFTPRLAKHAGEDARGKLRLPAGPFEVRLLRFGTFENFAVREFIPDLLADHEVHVEMRSAALNFKETLWALGFLNPNNRPAIGFDFGMEGAGRVKRVGARVSHVKPGDDVIVWHNGCLSSDFVVSMDKVIRKPEILSYAEAACIPTVFMTAYYALYRLAHIKAGDKVLIHAAAGGVGQVAIQIAKAAGAEIYATASEGKWKHLRQQGIEHVFDSRAQGFSEKILELTNGAGVDIVFNSLAGDFIPRSFDALGRNGRFVEIGKKDAWSSERAASYRPDVEYHFFELGDDLVSGGIGGSTIINELMTEILQDFESGKLKPLSMTEFPIGEIQQAYRFLSAGKNVGKVVVSFDRPVAGQGQASLAREDRTYLITGGLGGLGFLCAEWLIGQGAKHIALTSRREPGEEHARKIRDLNKIGINVHVMRGDVGNYDDIAGIVKTIEANGAPLGGVLHCAGVLEDALIEQQTAEKFTKVFKPKVDGVLHLHELTRELSLEFFVSFSSVSAILDGGGQSNYAAANAFMDRLMSYRRSQNLPGLSVNWGAWAGAGMAAELAERRVMDTSHFISQGEAFLSLERLLLTGGTQGVVCRLGNRLTTDAKSRLLINLARQGDKQAGVGDLERIFMQNPDNSARANMEIFLKAQVNKVLGVSVDESVDADAEFVSLGVDSLSMTELKNAVQQGLGKTLKMAAFFANPTVTSLAKHLVAEHSDRLAFNGGPAPVDSPASAVVQPGQRMDFISLGSNRGDKTLFCFPGLNGNVFDFSDFVTESKNKFNVWIGDVNAAGSTLETDICKLAADAVLHIKRLQPAGPYSLLGYSYGGVVALEIAHQLRKLGEEVEMLMMIDSFPHFHFRHDERFMNFMAALIVDSILAPMKLEAGRYETLATQIMQTPADQLAELFQQALSGGSDKARVNLDLLNDIFEAGKKRQLAFYEPPKSIDGVTVNYVRANRHPPSIALAKLDGFLEESSMRDEKYSWGRFVDNEFNVRRVDAQHNEILKAKNARSIVEFVEEVMQAQFEVS